MKRTKAQEAFDTWYASRRRRQEEFDLAKQGWAFCSRAMLEEKVAQCAKQLPPGDTTREAELDTMCAALARISST